MEYREIIPATFCTRENRFIAQVNLDGQKTTVHVKNTGRCRELLQAGATVYLERSHNPNRKTQYDLVAVEKGERLINMDAQAPNRLFQEWAQAGHFRPHLTLLRPETRFGSSRFDFYWEDGTHRGFVEVKGVTLEEQGIVRFPDAPTERGVKHLNELIEAKRAGYEAAICFVVQMSGVRFFTPNEDTHPEFGAALRAAADAGVEVIAYDCQVTKDTAVLDRPVPVHLGPERI